MADRFFTPQPLSPGEVSLDGTEAHHLATVRRFSSGDRVVLFNGDGREYPAEIIAASKKNVVLNVFSEVKTNREVGFPLVIAAALPKGDRADYLIEKLTELGATQFIPLRTERSVVLPKDAKIEKFERAVIEASKQCGRNVLMTVDAPQSWDAFLTRTDLPPTRVVSHTAPGTSLRDVVEADVTRGIVVAVGPEGGFTDDEIARAVANGWQIVSFGSRVLRVETAAAAAVAWLAMGR